MATGIPLTEKARETRQRLLETSRSLFEQEGYDVASISRIVEGAQVSRGTFYLYFESKEHVFRTLALELQERLLQMQEWAPSERLRPDEGIRQAIARFLVFYRENARLMAVLEQIATYDEEFRALRLDMRRAVARRAIRFIENLQRGGVVPTTVDARYAATALTGMVDRFAYVWLVLGEEFNEDTAAENLARLWYQAIGGTIEPAAR